MNKLTFHFDLRSDLDKLVGILCQAGYQVDPIDVYVAWQSESLEEGGCWLSVNAYRNEDVLTRLLVAFERNQTSWSTGVEKGVYRSPGHFDKDDDQVRRVSPTPRSHWNLRVIEFENEQEKWFSLHEVYYSYGKPVGYAEPLAGLMWTQDDEPNAGQRWVQRVQRALSEPVLRTIDFDGNT